MGTTTPNIGIYIPAAGETNYDASFAAGMVNVDQHDHSGGPNKGVPIATSGIADGSITAIKLNANVVDPGEGLAVSGSNPNALQAAGLLNAIFKLVSTGMIAKTGATTAAARTITPVANQTTVSNGDGVAGNPVVGLAANPHVTGISFDAGAHTLNNYTFGTFPVLPEVQFGGASVGITYATQFGYYLRIGGLCFVTIFLNMTSKGSSTGAATIANLPFTVLNIQESGRLLMVPGTITFSAGNTMVFGNVVENTTDMQLEQAGTGIGPTQMDDTNFANNSLVIISGCYLVA